MLRATRWSAADKALLPPRVTFLMLAKGACASAIRDQGSRVVRHGVAGQGKGSDVGDADSGKRSTEPDTSTAASSVPNVSLSRGHLLHPRRWRYCDAIHGEGVGSLVIFWGRCKMTIYYWKIRRGIKSKDLMPHRTCLSVDPTSCASY